jgi:putative pyruvate formate lyase activating enzyme
MSQYTPISWQLGDHPELNRRITRREYDRVVDYAVSIGVTNAYIQERDVAVESFIPQWDIK